MAGVQHGDEIVELGSAGQAHAQRAHARHGGAVAGDAVVGEDIDGLGGLLPRRSGPRRRRQRLGLGHGRVLAVNGGGHHRPHHFHEVAGKGLRHFHEIVAGKTDALEALHGEHLQLLHTGLHLVVGQVGLEPLENVLGQSALLGGAGHAPCLLETHDSVLGGGVTVLGGLLEGGQVQMEPEARVAGLAGGHCAGQVVFRSARAVVAGLRGCVDIL